MNTEQINVNFNDSQTQVSHNVTSNISEDGGGIHTASRTKTSRSSRSRWGNKRPVIFAEGPSTVQFTAPIPTTPKEIADCSFMQKTVMDHTNDTTQPKNAVETNTYMAEFKTSSILHIEGGWPKEINAREPEVVDKTKKKMQRDENYVESVPSIAKDAEYLIRHNNALRLCDSNSSKSCFRKLDAKPSVNMVSVYRCPLRQKRPVSKITFAPGNGSRMAVAYFPYEFDPELREQSCEAFFWDMEIPTKPEGMVRASSQIVDLRYHQKDMHSICGALFSGQVASWDNRVGMNPQATSSHEMSHEDVCTSAMWINSKTGYELFSCGLDGMVIWWDVRNLKERLDTVYADPVKGRNDKEHAIPITLLEYEHSLPTKFLAGTQFGQVMVYMKKGKTPQDRLVNLYEACKGPVHAIHRNPVFIKNFMSCGDYHVRIFAEDCRESGIMWTAPKDALYTYAQWLIGRPCSLVASRSDGCLEFWDFLMQGISSVLTTKVCEEGLSTVWPADDGFHLAAGTVNGDIRMVRVCSFLNTFERSDKSALAACFDRESRREKYLEQRFREIKLAKKHLEAETLKNEIKADSEMSSGEAALKEEAIQEDCIKLDKEYFTSLANVKKKGQEDKGKNLVDKKELNDL